MTKGFVSIFLLISAATFCSSQIDNVVTEVTEDSKNFYEILKIDQTKVSKPWEAIRLPVHIIPLRYDLKLTLNILQADFEGVVQVEINITEKTDYILIHENGLQILKTELRSLVPGERKIPIDKTFPFKENNFWVILLKEGIPKGSYALEMEFLGNMTSFSFGISRYNYIHRQTKERRYLVATTFEPSTARNMFPCFDEPEMKAKFKLGINHDSNYTALSNMPVETITYSADNKVKTVFMESVPMSTYILCFVLSDYGFLETDYRGIKVRAYAPPDRLHEAEHGLNWTIKMLRILEEYLDIPYTLPKLDSVAIPNYPAGAMEHWGIVTYGFNSFLADEESSLNHRMMSVDVTIPHELAHQWFGNLVTMKWWNDLWLNEGLSSFFEYVPLKHYYPSIDEMQVKGISTVMCSDSSIETSPILKKVIDDSKLERLFNDITYVKGGAVLRMLEYTLKDDFRKGLSNYLKKYAYKNTVTQDLWDELSAASHMNFNITEMMNTWTYQQGFPYVDLKREGSTLTATQHQFMFKLNDNETENMAHQNSSSRFGYIWKIPLIYKNLVTGNENTLWLNEKSATFDINAMKDDVIKFNPGFTGYYTVKYDDNDWARLATRLQLKHEDFSVVDRYSLLNDAFMLAESDRLTYDIPMELTKYLKRERELTPWELFRVQFTHFVRRLDSKSETLRLLKKYVADLTADVYDEIMLDSKNSSYFKKLQIAFIKCVYTSRRIPEHFGVTIVNLACESQNTKCLDVVHEQLQRWMLGENITTDLSFVLQMAVPHFGNDTLWQFLYEKLTANGTEIHQKLWFIKGLVSFRGSMQIEKTIDIILNDPAVDAATAKDLFTGLATNADALPILWSYTKNHFQLLVDKLETDRPMFVTMVLRAVLVATPYFEEFIMFLQQGNETLQSYVEFCMTATRDEGHWSGEDEETLLTWLKSNEPNNINFYSL